MGLIREPLDIDFFVDPRPITEEEERLISTFICNQKRKATTPVRATQQVLRNKKVLFKH